MLGVYRKGRKEKLRSFAVIEQRKSVEPEIRCRCLLSAIVGGMMTIAGRYRRVRLYDTHAGLVGDGVQKSAACIESSRRIRNVPTTAVS